MDGILALLIVLIAFVILVYIINRSAKTFIILGIIVVAYIVLSVFGVLG